MQEFQDDLSSFWAGDGELDDTRPEEEQMVTGVPRYVDALSPADLFQLRAVLNDSTLGIGEHLE